MWRHHWLWTFLSAHWLFVGSFLCALLAIVYFRYLIQQALKEHNPLLKRVELREEEMAAQWAQLYPEDAFDLEEMKSGDPARINAAISRHRYRNSR